MEEGEKGRTGKGKMKKGDGERGKGVEGERGQGERGKGGKGESGRGGKGKEGEGEGGKGLSTVFETSHIHTYLSEASDFLLVNATLRLAFSFSNLEISPSSSRTVSFTK